MALFPNRLRDLFTRVRYGAIELTNKRYEKIAVKVLELGQDIQELSNKELKYRSAEQPFESCPRCFLETR